MPYIAVVSELNDDDYIHVDIYKSEYCLASNGFYVGRNSYEVAIKIYVFYDYTNIPIWLEGWFTPDFIEQNIPDFENMDYFAFDYWLVSKKYNETGRREYKEEKNG